MVFTEKFAKDNFKYSVLGIYIEKLGELLKGEVPTRFEEWVRALESFIPDFPENEQGDYKKICEAGWEQADYLRAKQTVDALKKDEAKRLKVIQHFLEEAKK